MGRRVSDGKTFNAVAPSGQIINDYDLYRIGGWNGCAIGAKDATQTDRSMAFDMDNAAIFSIKAPAGITPAVGDRLYWATMDLTTFQRGDTHLALAPETAGDAAAFVVTEAKNAAGYIRGRVLNLGD